MKNLKWMMILVILLMAIMAGCYGMSRTQQTTVSGAAIGGVGGGLLGEAVGNHPLAGAAIGAGVGALGGYILGEEGRGYYSGGRGGHRR